MRKTRASRLVVDLLQTYAKPFSLQELHDRVREQLPRTAFSTIYRVVCGICGRSVDIEDADLGFSEQRIRAATGFLVNYHSIELEGICPSCQRSGSGE